MDSLTEILASEIGPDQAQSDWASQPKEALWAGLGSLDAGMPGKIPALWLARPTLASLATTHVSLYKLHI